jgi:hypothetical protein
VNTIHAARVELAVEIDGDHEAIIAD